MKFLILIFSICLGLFPPIEKELNVYIFIAEECPICNYMGKSLSQMADEYQDQVNFYAVFPVKNSNYKTINQFKKKYKLEAFESILDKNQSLTKTLGASVTPEAVVTDSSGNILYRGRINDSYFAPGKIRHGARKYDLKKVIHSYLSSSPLPKKWEKAVGCFITFY